MHLQKKDKKKQTEKDKKAPSVGNIIAVTVGLDVSTKKLEGNAI